MGWGGREVGWGGGRVMSNEPGKAIIATAEGSNMCPQGDSPFSCRGGHTQRRWWTFSLSLDMQDVCSTRI